jgi:hypothetical protein
MGFAPYFVPKLFVYKKNWKLILLIHYSKSFKKSYFKIEILKLQNDKNRGTKTATKLFFFTFGGYDSLSKWKLSNIVLYIIRHDYGCQAGLIVVNG